MAYSVFDDIAELVNDGELDHHIIADKVAADVPARALRDTVKLLLPEAVLLQQRQRRARLLGHSAGMEQRDRTTSGVNEQFRDVGWDIVYHIRRVDGTRFSIALGAMTSEQHRLVAHDYRVRAQANSVRAEQHETLAGMIPEGGVTRDLLWDDVYEVLK